MAVEAEVEDEEINIGAYEVVGEGERLEIGCMGSETIYLQRHSSEESPVATFHFKKL